jgi:hypothetical protein
VTDTPVAAEIHESLDIHGNLSAQVTFSRELSDFRADIIQLFRAQFSRFRSRCNACGVTDLLRFRWTNTENISE